VADIPELRARWAAAVAPAPEGVELGDDLIARWSERHRRYHNLDHLLAVLRRLDWLGASAQSTCLAAWYHDAFYAPDRDDNERRSAELASTTLPVVGVAEPVVSEVCRLVALTGSHSPDGQDLAGGALCDADLAVLGSTPAAYASYRRALRAEYGYLDAAAWRAGRASVLGSILDRRHIYSTIPGRARWEATARRNLIEELGELRL
jgi:predicted metal-dependent HD superfamily phosphohydrolase